LELVPAAEHDWLTKATEASERRAAALRAIVRPLTGGPPADAETAYRALQRDSRAALGELPAAPALPASAQAFTTWWCPRCGGIDAPQPCLGVCVWRPVEWVAAERYEEARERAAAAFAQEHALRARLRRAANVTPRAGQWQRCWEALAR
jgi:hypothetical protein